MKKVITIVFTFAMLLLCAFGVKAENKYKQNVPFEKVDFKKTKGLFEKEVIDYYKVDKKLYDSPLKEKKYKESDEYAALVKKFENEQETALGQTYEVSADFKDQYDLSKSNFTVKLPKDFGKKLVLKTNNPYFSKNMFTTPTIDEDTAYKIELGKCKFIVVMKITGKIESNKLVCIPLQVIIRSKAGEDLFVYDVDGPANQNNE